MTINNQPDEDYYVFYDEDGVERGIDYIDKEDADDRLSWDWNDEVSYKLITNNKDHFFRGYYFWNDEDDYDNEEGWVTFDAISEEHTHLYQELNNGGGHFQMIKSEEWKNGKMINTTVVSTAEGYV